MSRIESPRKIVLITGASAGIGAAVAREAARRGYSLVLTARRGDRLSQLAEEVEAAGASSLVVPAALEDPETPERLVLESVARFGGLDVVVNNAGIGLPRLFSDCEPDLIRRQIEVNLVAPMLLARHALPYLTERKGVLINVGSAITAIPNPALGAYGATKAALAYWSSALRREIGHTGVSVCLVEPGPIRTEFFSALSGLSGHWHPMLDAPSGWMSGDSETAARRIVRLIERPRRRLSVPKRFVWPWRLLGEILRACPPLGDLAVSSVVRHYDGVDPRTRSASHASPRD